MLEVVSGVTGIDHTMHSLTLISDADATASKSPVLNKEN
jgi:hypothetical protein